ncbi:NUMOD4 motif-containing HNH endonuclease [Gordonia paraffinivorans]|uniref:NUMOD4 motif-containing HNH endonuclease n=1 Tax=Gordonia paraffinivorans TaxID=175628 RepID=UPI003FCE6038
MGEHTPTEIWRPIARFNGDYEASNLGRVRSMKRATPRILSQHFNGRYMVVMTSMHGYYRPYGVHQLVLLAFCGEPPEGWHGCHYDGDPKNNRLENLRWDSPKGNAADMRRHNRHRNGRKTHCKRGHEFTPENTIVRKGGKRACRTCVRNRDNENYRKYGKRRAPATDS